MRNLTLWLVTAAATAAVTSPSAAQHPCSTLKVDGSGRPGTHLTFTLSRADTHAPAVLFIAGHTGRTVLHFGSLGSLTLGLEQPLIMVLLGATSGHGAAAVVLPVPLHVPELALHAQGTSVRVVHEHPPLMFCTSNVAGFHVGGHS
jgi:hypothetical protein